MVVIVVVVGGGVGAIHFTFKFDRLPSSTTLGPVHYCWHYEMFTFRDEDTKVGA